MIITLSLQKHGSVGGVAQNLQSAKNLKKLKKDTIPLFSFLHPTPKNPYSKCVPENLHDTDQYGSCMM